MAPRLSAVQRAQLPLLLAKGAEAYGYRGDSETYDDLLSRDVI